MSGRNRSAGGFTYVALLIWVAMLGAWLAALGPVWQTLAKHEREQELLHVGNQFRAALDRYHASNGHFPLRLEDLVLDRRAAVKRHLRKIFADPVTGQAQWGTVKLADGQIVGIHSLSDARPLKRTGFSAADATFENKPAYSSWIFAATARNVARRPERPDR